MEDITVLRVPGTTPEILNVLNSTATLSIRHYLYELHISTCEVLQVPTGTVPVVIGRFLQVLTDI